MLLVDDQQAKFGKRQEQGGAGADHRAHLALRHTPPGALAGARGDAGVPFARPRPEARLEAVEELRRQRDFRNQNKHLPPGFQRLRDRLEIDLRLAGPRHALDQRDGKRVGVDALPQLSRRRLLVVAQRRRRIVGIGIVDHWRRRQRDPLQRPGLHQPLDDGGTGPGGLRQRALVPGKPVGGDLQDTLARRRHPFRRFTRKPDGRHRLFRPEGFRHAQQHPQHRAAMAQRIVGDPVDEPAHLFADMPVELLGDIPQLFRRHVVGRPVPDDPEHRARP